MSEKKGKDGLIEFLIENSGKPAELQWSELAERFELDSAEIARHTWRKYKRLGKAVELVKEFQQQAMQFKFEEDVANQSATITTSVEQEIKTLDELITKTNIDTTKWVITKWIQNFWNNRYQVKAWLEPKSKYAPQHFAEEFQSFLKTYTPAAQPISSPIITGSKPFGCFVLNKQDLHLNKLDIAGSNCIQDRMNRVFEVVKSSVAKAKLSYDLDGVVYVIGSDQFNSEWTSMTTKGTPQQNMLPFHAAFKTICDHETAIINLLLESSERVNLIYVSGNHDEFVGWHLVNWLSAFYRNEKRLKIDDGTSYRKYAKYSNTAMMFNHGDAIKPEKLAALFPMEFKDDWSDCDHYYIFTGDKHHLMAKDFNGIQFFQLPSASAATSAWDDKNGHVASKAEIMSFVISDMDGMSDIYKNYL